MNKREEIRALTGIRGCAATWVVGFHFYTIISLLFPSVGWYLKAGFKPGFLGVDLFFVLSGFVIAYNYQDKLTPFRFVAFKEFLYARLARIYPVHLATLLACLALLVGAKILNLHLNTEATNWGAWNFLANIAMVHAWTVNFHDNWNFPSWSISCEWLAYLCFPALVALLAHDWNRRTLWTIVGLLLGVYLYLNIVKSDMLHLAFAKIIFEFPSGMCLYQLSFLRAADLNRTRFPIPELIAIAIFTMMVASTKFDISSALMIPLLAVMLYFLATHSRSPLSRLLACPFACYWGRVSYSLYMTHAVTSMVMIRLLPLPAFAGRSMIVRLSACTIFFLVLGLVAMLVYHFIEEPARRRIRQLISSETSQPLATRQTR